MGILLHYFMYWLSYSSLKLENVVKFCVHISPIFSCRVTFIFNIDAFFVRNLFYHWYHVSFSSYVANLHHYQSKNIILMQMLIIHYDHVYNQVLTDLIISDSLQDSHLCGLRSFVEVTYVQVWFSFTIRLFTVISVALLLYDLMDVNHCKLSDWMIITRKYVVISSN